MRYHFCTKLQWWPLLKHMEGICWDRTHCARPITHCLLTHCFPLLDFILSSISQSQSCGALVSCLGFTNCWWNMVVRHWENRSLSTIHLVKKRLVKKKLWIITSRTNRIQTFEFFGAKIDLFGWNQLQCPRNTNQKLIKHFGTHRRLQGKLTSQNLWDV